ncbi:hypothetical protein LEP1GSC013_2120 [Leptospira interrogans serovar Valbuzzi str. Duyster]|nr:hypothetical protein LEP1GSC013_2120 [Leptospira interrogans serovar Valbuzzi str. Duyster]ENO71134.1 hypothetical protein LEP1GSC012_0958 [Leptospira interrogans serovar Valbuzzi str. Valbuzzi]
MYPKLTINFIKIKKFSKIMPNPDFGMSSHILNLTVKPANCVSSHIFKILN